MEYGKSDHYAGDKGTNYFSYQNRQAILRAKIDALNFKAYIGSTDCVLDFGCGGGWILRELGCAKRLGVEINEAAHPICQANGVKVYKHIKDVIESNIDVIITHHCLEHVPYPIEALRQLYKLLKPDGFVIIVVPIDDWRTQRDHTGSDVDHHLHTWTPRLIANTLMEAGFNISECKILRHAMFRYWEILVGKLPQFLFYSLCILWSIIRRRRELLVIAQKTVTTKNIIRND